MTSILVVDDDKAVRDSIRMILEYAKYDVQFAPDGPSALTRVSTSTVDLVLLDIKMPGMDGLSNPPDLLGDCADDRLLETIRLLDRDPETDIIVCAIYFQVPYLTEYIGERLLELREEMTKPWILSPRGFSEYVAHTRKYLADNGVPTYTVPMVKSLAVALEIWKRYDMDFCSP